MRALFVPALHARSVLLRHPRAHRDVHLSLRCLATSPVSATPMPVAVGKRLSSSQIREMFLAFYASKGHKRTPSASLVPDDPSILLTIAGMVPFKPVFMGVRPPPDPPRVTTSQKCIRTNDIENVGVTKRHHTFFEMLGNFSFGDYFKRDAIRWAWQLLTEEYGIPPARLAVSVFEDDDDALAIWRDEVGVPTERIIRMGAADNFWAAGPTGPCGPCSEIYFDFDPTSMKPIDLDDDIRFIEIYNLVFMQFSRAEDGSLSPLASRNIDTGLGLERLAQVLQQVESNYETDLIRPIIDRVAEIAGFSYDNATLSQRTSLKVVSDHSRAIAHLIADGVRPSNVGRGYIVRRLLRRVVRHGRLLGIDSAFVPDVLPVVESLATQAGITAVSTNMDSIITEVSSEEDRFLQTLIRGEARLEELFASVPDALVSGDTAFELYDTFGFPLELTEEIARERGLTVDSSRFDECMQQQRERARAARDTVSLDSDVSRAVSDAAVQWGPTLFSGYDALSVSGAIVQAIIVEDDVNIAGKDDRVRIILDRTPFYAEGGGQVGDSGIVRSADALIAVHDTVRLDNAYVHIGEVVSGTVRVGDIVDAAVDAPRRRRIRAHHTATHLLQAALKRVLPDSGVSQAGSLVDEQRLRFDFNCSRALTADEITDVETLVNNWIDDAHGTVVSHMTLNEATTAGAVAMFGEKYAPADVRVVDFPGVSMELCGGTHVANTADIALFKIVSESGPAAAIRRIEAVCGPAALPYLQTRDTAVRSLSAALKAPAAELPARVASLQGELRAARTALDEAREQLAAARALGLLGDAVRTPAGAYVVARLDGVRADALKTAAQTLATKLGDNAAAVLAAVDEDGTKVAFAAAVGSSAIKTGTVQAGKLVGRIAKICGGGGGGRPALAQAGARDASKVDDALAEAERILDTAFNR